MEQQNVLKRERDLLKLYVKSRNDTVLLMDCKGNILYRNPDNRDFFSDEGDSALLSEMQELLCSRCGRSAPEGRKSVLIRRGESTYEAERLPLPDEPHCILAVRDLSDQKCRQEEQNIYYTSLIHVKQPIIITDAEGRVIFTNPQFEKLFGYTLDEIRGKNPSFLNPGPDYYYNIGYPEEKYKALFNDLWQKISDPRVATWSGEIPNQRRDGTLIWVELMIDAVYTEDGQISHYIGIPHDITERRERELSSQLEIFNTITDLAELRDNETGNHILRVAQYSRRIAEKIGMPYKFCEDIQRFAPFHDVGKVGIPDEILLKPGRLDQEEFEKMKEHTRMGYELLESKTMMKMAAEIALNHHEKFDGSGYPNQLKGKEIPLSARIIAIADVYDALRSERPYKKTWSHEKAIEEMSRMKGTHFDPELFDAFMHIKDKILTISLYLAD